MSEAAELDRLVAEIRACRHCEAHLPLGPRPILHVSPTARLLIASQAPGTKVHEKGISFWDQSGERLRGWLGIGKDVFYDTAGSRSCRWVCATRAGCHRAATGRRGANARRSGATGCCA